MKNKMKRILLITIFCWLIFSGYVFAEEIPDELKNLYARSAVLMDADSGRILFGKEENNVLPMASTTKIMTCIIALENMTSGQICEVSDYAIRQPKVHLGMKISEKYYLEDLLYSLMLESHNDSAVAIAEEIAGSVEKFAALMNKKAQEIGCTDTYFITPNGLDAEDNVGVHSTTASDLAHIMRYCIGISPQKEKFIHITRTKTYEFRDVSGSRKFICHNHNAFLDMMDGALSGKTGFTNNAGYCYVGALKRGDRTFIVALLACGWPNNKAYKWSDTTKLMQYGVNNYKYKNIWKDIKIDKIFVENGFCRSDPLKKTFYVKCQVKNDNTNYYFLMKDNEYIEVKLLQQKELSAPVKKGEVIGRIYFMLNDNIIKQFEVITEESIEKRTVKNYLNYVLDKFL